AGRPAARPRRVDRGPRAARGAPAVVREPTGGARSGARDAGLGARRDRAHLARAARRVARARAGRARAGRAAARPARDAGVSAAAPAAPIFLVGAPRSGTTLLRSMLNRHPCFALCDETFFFYWVARRARAFGDLESDANRRRVVERLLEMRRVRRLGLDADALRARLLAEGTSYARLFESLLRCYADAQGKARCGEKTPQHALFA